MDPPVERPVPAVMYPATPPILPAVRYPATVFSVINRSCFWSLYANHTLELLNSSFTYGEGCMCCEVGVACT